MSNLTFLGTSGSVVTKDRMCAGILFQDKLLDVGFGVLANLLKSRTKLESINDIYVTHTHSDHIGDFTGLMWAMAMENRARPVRVVSSIGVANALKKVLELQSTPWSFVKFKIEFIRPEKAGTRSMVTIHDPENLAYRFDTQGGDFVYVGDTARFDRVADFAKGCDLLIHDATFLGGQESIATVTKHSTARDAARTARLAGAKRLVLTHISPSNEHAEKQYLAEAGSTFDGEIVVATDHRTVNV